MTRDDANRLKIRHQTKYDDRMNAWNAVTEDPSRSEEGRRQWTAYKQACRDYEAARHRLRRAIDRHPAAFHPFVIH